LSVRSTNRLEIGAVILAVMAFLVFLGFALVQLVDIERDTHSSSDADIVWAVAQAQYEIQRLLAATGPDSEETTEEIVLRFDVAVSRLVLLDEGQMGRRIAEIGHASVIRRAKASLLGFETVILQSGAEDARYGRRLAREMGQYLEPLGSIATGLMIDNRTRDNDRRRHYSHTIVEVMASILGILVSGGFLIFRLGRSLRRAAEADARLRRERNFLALLLESSGEGIAAFDEALVCTHWNEGMAQMSGIAAEEALGRPMRADEPITRALLERTLTGHGSYLPAQLSEAGTYHERLLCPIRLNGATVGGILVLRDVTGRYEAQRERQLREVYKDFVALVSHQFRTPLAIIDSSVQRMMRRGTRMLPDELNDRANSIREATRALSRLMDSTLNAARIDAGEIDLTLRPTDMAALLEDVCTRLSDLHADRDLRLDIAGLVDPVDADEVLIDQVLTNLVTNAIKYSPGPTPVIITAGQDGDMAWISVADQGVGIPEDERPRVFERFFRASTASAFQGTGVGLYVARQIALLHGGTIEIAPDTGVGTTFTFRIPLRSPARIAS